MHYMKCSKVMLPVVLNFQELELVCNFLLLFFFSVLLSIGKKSPLAKIWGVAALPQPLFLLACSYLISFNSTDECHKTFAVVLPYFTSVLKD